MTVHPRLYRLCAECVLFTRRQLVVQVACGEDFTAAIDAAGNVYTVWARPGRLSTLSVLHINMFCMALLYGRAGRKQPKNGGFWPGQWGSNEAGQLGHGEPDDDDVVRARPGYITVAAIEAPSPFAGVK